MNTQAVLIPSTQPLRPRSGPHRGRLARAVVTTLTLLPLIACAPLSTPTSSNLPPTDRAPEPPQVLLVWVGQGQASVNVGGQWRRVEAQDYQFAVTQRRYGQHWESIKVQHRRHPDYDGSAGPRDQTHHFRVDFAPTADAASTRPFQLTSSLGDGPGQLDAAFRDGRMDFAARGVSRFAPFDHYRITQRYRYEEGLLTERVELYKRQGDKEVPFMRIEERATLMAPQRFEGTP